MKILIIGDLHGRKPTIKLKDFDAIVLIGDICDDRDIAPLYKKWFRKLASEDNSFLNFEEFAERELKSKTKLYSYEVKSLKRGAEILRYIDSIGKPVFMVAGNWDQSYGRTRIENMDKNDYNYFKAFYDFWQGDKINPTLMNGLTNVENCMFCCHEFGGINFVGYGLSSRPEDLGDRREMRDIKLNKIELGKLKRAYIKIQNKLGDAYKNRKNKKLPTIFITHNIPHKTKLDLIKDKGSYVFGKHLGSTVARKFCSKFKPMICIGGHIHDCRGKDKIGKTVVINPGMGNVLIEFDEKKGRIKRIEFVK